MTPRHYLCADLLTLERKTGNVIVNLEEIWETGAVCDSELALEECEAVEFQGGAHRFCGWLVSVEPYQFGCRAVIEFSPLTPWSPERFLPKHMLDLSTLKEKED